MATLGIVTTVGTYEHFIPEWYESVRLLRRQPDSIVIAAQNAANVTEMLDDPRVQVVQPDRPFQFGTYLNHAVERCKTDWVAWLGVDDLYRLHAFDDIDQVEADIRVFGMRISDGREWLGHEFDRVRQLNPIPCGSPFRRWIWKKTPFQPQLAPYEDWAFWVSAHAHGATIEPAACVHFDYRLHPDQIVPEHKTNAERIRLWAQQNFDGGVVDGDH